MLVFLDTEYSGFSRPATERKLISLALVTEDGKKEWYEEFDGWSVDDCSPWVQQHVLPLITDHRTTRQAAKASLVEWFGSLPRKVKIACDSETDWQFLKALLEVLPANLARDRYDLAQLITNSIYHHTVIGYFQKGNPEHHSLHDARAYRLGWLAWMSQNKLHHSWESFADLPKAGADFLESRSPVFDYIDTAIWHTLYLLADYPVLAALANERTKAKRLDGRACAAIYEAAQHRIDWQALSVSERAFMHSLGIKAAIVKS